MYAAEGILTTREHFLMPIGVIPVRAENSNQLFFAPFTDAKRDACYLVFYNYIDNLAEEFAINDNAIILLIRAHNRRVAPKKHDLFANQESSANTHGTNIINLHDK